MMTKLRHLPIVFALLLPALSLPVRANREEEQERSERARVRPQYEIKLTIHFLTDGKRVSHKDYSIVLGNDNGGKIRTLKKVPVELQHLKIEYVETGVKCDAKYEIKEGGLELSIELVMSSFSETEGETIAKSSLHEVQCRVEANIVPGTPTVIARLDAPDSNAGYEIEVLATPVAVRQ
ncbi:MAG: hypothetical protein EHM23_34050 [Acidobacteria bacterium]|nr:MAG: hypothetical protein EHM23_34050 [Acidobacteriota bacterium]